MFKRIAGVLAAALVIVPLSAGSSSAENSAFADDVGDAPSSIDLTYLVFNNGNKKITAKTEFAVGKVKKGLCQTVFIDEGKHLGYPIYAVTSCKHKHKPSFTALYKRTRHNPAKRLKCPGMRHDWSEKGKLHFKVTVPQSCVHKVGKTWLSAGTSKAKGSGTDESYRVKLARG